MSARLPTRCAGARREAGRQARFRLAAGLALLAACTCESPPESPPLTPVESLNAARCELFCQRSLACARAAGRSLPAGAEDCATSCRPGGIHHSAPPVIFACAEETDCDAFQRCTLEGVNNAMRTADVAVFPPVCEGLCHKLAYCAERVGLPTPGAAQACANDCSAGGLLAQLPDEALLCVHEECGAPFERCVGRHGLAMRAAGPAATPPSRAPPSIPGVPAAEPPPPPGP